MLKCRSRILVSSWVLKSAPWKMLQKCVISQIEFIWVSGCYCLVFFRVLPEVLPHADFGLPVFEGQAREEVRVCVHVVQADQVVSENFRASLRGIPLRIAEDFPDVAVAFSEVRDVPGAGGVHDVDFGPG